MRSKGKRTVEELNAQISELRQELNELEMAERLPRMRALVGTCWRYRDSYGSDPVKRFWCYKIITECTADGWLTALVFSVDKEGSVRVSPDEHSYEPRDGSGWRRIPASVAKSALRDLVAHVNGLWPAGAA